MCREAPADGPGPHIRVGWEDRPAEPEYAVQNGPDFRFHVQHRRVVRAGRPGVLPAAAPNAAQDIDKDRFHAPGRPHSPRTVFHVQLRSVPAGRPRFRGRLTLEGSGQKCRSVASCLRRVPAEASCRQAVRNDTGQHSRQHQVIAARRKSEPRPGVTQPTVGSIPAKPSVRPAEDVASAPQACAAGTEATRVDTREARSGPVRGIGGWPGPPSRKPRSGPSWGSAVTRRRCPEFARGHILPESKPLVGRIPLTGMPSQPRY